jgi:hypothetical protein
MSVASLAMPCPSTRSRRLRKPASLTLMLDGVPYDVRAFDIGDIDGDGLSINGMEHRLTCPKGENFQVYGCFHEETGEHGNYCERCERDGCHHIVGLAGVGLL